MKCEILGITPFLELLSCEFVFCFFAVGQAYGLWEQKQVKSRDLYKINKNRGDLLAW